MATELTRIGILLALAMVWAWINLKAGYGWLKMMSLVLLLAFLAGASILAFRMVFHG